MSSYLQGKSEMKLGMPKEIQLTPSKELELDNLTRQQLSAMDFWKHQFTSRGITCPQGRVCMMIYRAPGHYGLEWHRKALGPKAIAAGRDYRAFAKRKDREFAARASR